MGYPIPKLKCLNAEKIASFYTPKQAGQAAKIFCDISSAFFFFFFSLEHSKMIKLQNSNTACGMCSALDAFTDTKL